MSYAVLKGASYILVHTPDMILHNGTTCGMEKHLNPESEFLKEAEKSLRNYEEVVNYLPNQVYIGNMKPEELRKYEMPWYDKKAEGKREGKFGEIMPQDEFIGLMKICDAFDLVKLTKEFTKEIKEKLSAHPLMTQEQLEKLKEGEALEEIDKILKEQHGEGLYHLGKLVGCIKRAHEVDANLNAHIIFENLVVKASGVLSVQHLLSKYDIDPMGIEYVIECSEEACGDMNQRGGGNFAKAIAEVVGLQNATGSDTRGFCAGPTHALIQGAALVKAGVYENVIVVGGGATAKLGMNGKDHVKKGMPILEDVLGGFAVLISKNDGVNPIIRTDLIGRHTVGTGSSPQAVITSLITTPLDKGGLKITDIDTYSVEMQNPDITKPAGAGDVPEANYKMIAALGVKRGELERKDISVFVQSHGLPGWAPTQGHIPSGVPYIGFAIEDLTTGSANKAMVVGKGSLFLARMTNLFDGVSFVVERNAGLVEEEKGISQEEIKNMIAKAMKKLAAHLLEE